MKYAVVIPARNEQNHIAKTLAHLFTQSIKPSKVIVVNDCSTDLTKTIALLGGAQVIDFPYEHENWVTKPELAKVINLGLKQINPNDFDYTMILGSDHLLPTNYVEEITKRMDGNAVVASGSIKNEFGKVPRGSGRLINNKFFKAIGFEYPINYGYESWLLLKAWQIDLGAQYYSDVETTVQRKTAIKYKPIMYFHYGKAMKALGYTTPYLFARAGVLSKRHWQFGIELIKGYFSKDTKLYDSQVRAYTKSKQYSRLKQLYKPKQLKAVTMRMLA